MSDYDQLEFRHLKYILAIAEEGSFTAAASRVFTTQSNVSTQILQLEEVFEVQIFKRDRDGVEITPYGEVLLACARDMLQVREDAVNTLRALRAGAITPLRFGYSSLVDKRLLCSLTETTRRLLPICDIQSDGDEIEALEQRVGTGELDGALVTLPIQHSSDLMTSIVTREKLLVCMRTDDPLAEHEAVPTHLLNHRISLLQYPKVHPVAHARMLELLRAVSITPKPNRPTNNRDHIQWMIQERQCLAFFREGTRLLPGLTLRPIHGADWTIDTALILRPTSQHPALALLLRELRKGSGSFGTGYVARKPAPVQVTVKRKEPQSGKVKQHTVNRSLFESHG